MRVLQYFPTIEDPNTRRSLFEVPPPTSPSTPQKEKQKQKFHLFGLDYILNTNVGPLLILGRTTNTKGNRSSEKYKQE